MEPSLTEAEIQSHLVGPLRHWQLDNGWITRKYRTYGWKGTVMVIATIGHLAEAAWHHPDIAASYAWVKVKLITHSAKGITLKDIALATKIEDVIHWQPAHDGSPLPGTPDNDNRFAYIRYDD